MKSSKWDRFASPKAVLPTAWATAWLLRRKEGSLRLAIGTSIAVMVEETVKRLVSRRRPNRLGLGDRRSFPSGHSAGSLAYLLGAAWMVSPRYRPFAFAVACVSGAGINVVRVREREHWPTDVLAGDLIGVLGILGTHFVINGIPARSKGRPEVGAMP